MSNRTPSPLALSLVSMNPDGIDDESFLLAPKHIECVRLSDGRWYDFIDPIVMEHPNFEICWRVEVAAQERQCEDTLWFRMNVFWEAIERDALSDYHHNYRKALLLAARERIIEHLMFHPYPILSCPNQTTIILEFK